MMAAIRGRHTAPELAVRGALHAAGFRFRMHRRDLPGSPDVVLPKYRTVIFVHGCFWHRHPRCRFTTDPASNRSFWRRKFVENITRDRRQKRELRTAGWRVLTVWECQARKPHVIEQLIRAIRHRAGRQAQADTVVEKKIR
jgi:DNA mismatch endonuclease (patch repair protein)